MRGPTGLSPRLLVMADVQNGYGNCRIALAITDLAVTGGRQQSLMIHYW